jgi:hypothetical protein
MHSRRAVGPLMRCCNLTLVGCKPVRGTRPSLQCELLEINAFWISCNLYLDYEDNGVSRYSDWLRAGRPGGAGV